MLASRVRMRRKQSGSAAVQDGYWVHKSTGVKTYFGADASFIVNGIFMQPSWMVDAKEVRLCTGITGFETYEIESAPGIILSLCKTFGIDRIDIGVGYLWSNTIIEKIDFGNAAASSVPSYLAGVFTGTSTFLSEVVLSNNVIRIESNAFLNYLSMTLVDIPASVSYIGAGAFQTGAMYEAIVRNETPPQIGGAIFDEEIVSIKVPSQSVNAYKTDTMWSYYASKITSI